MKGLYGEVQNGGAMSAQVRYEYMVPGGGLESMQAMKEQEVEDTDLCTSCYDNGMYCCAEGAPKAWPYTLNRRW